MNTRAAVPLTLAFAIAASAAPAQVLSTADTLGRGTQSVFVSDNRIFVDGARLHILVGQYVRGLTDRVDLYLLASDTRTDDESGETVLDQASVGGGVNWRLGRWRGFGASLFGVASTPLNRRDQSCDVLANPALIVSRVVVPGRLAVYSGVNALVPIGHRSRGWFTPTKTQVNVPAGAMVMLGKWAVFGEADIGHLKALGVGLSRTWS
jgi:hypothetical protein